MKDGMVRVILNPLRQLKLRRRSTNQQTKLAEQHVIAGKVALPQMPALASGN